MQATDEPAESGNGPQETFSTTDSTSLKTHDYRSVRYVCVRVLLTFSCEECFRGQEVDMLILNRQN